MEKGFADFGEYNGKKIRAVNYDFQKMEMTIETDDGENHKLKIEKQDGKTI